MLPGRIPDLSEYQQRTPLTENYKTIYIRYKEATKRFYEFMMDQTPEEVRGKSCVNALIPAADWMKEQQFTLPKSVLKDLKLAIRTRNRVAKSVFGGGDEGHKYFLTVLIYCWTVLIVLPRSESASKTQEESEVDAGESNRYAVLGEEIDDDEENGQGDLEFLPSSPVARPQPQPEGVTLKELLEADDRHDATLFLLSLDELMAFVSNQYSTVLNNFNNTNREAGRQSADLVEDMLEAAVATNMAVQQVRTLEMALQEQHQHLSTPYRVLSAMVLPEMTQMAADIVKDHAAKKCAAKEILSFLGDCLESSFRAPSDTLNRKGTIVEEFCADYQVNADGATKIRKLFETFDQLLVMEVPVGAEKEQAHRLHRLFGLGRTSSHSWLKNMDFIGGNRAIHHTIRLLQSFGAAIRNTPDNQQLIPKRGFFGPSPWRPGRSRTTHGDLDELFLSDILPQWLLMCRKGIIGQSQLPFENEICPLFVALRDFVQSPGKPVTWSLAFAMHAMLTAILETDTIFDQLVGLQEAVFARYFDTVEGAMQSTRSERDFCSNDVFTNNMFVLSFMKNLGIDAFDARALWNPLCGGTILSYIAYFGNLEIGCTLVDCHAQLRITLHLFNALLANGFIDAGQIPFLDILHKAFKSSRGVWEGPLPEKGQFVQRFWICYGMNPQDAKQMAEKAKSFYESGGIIPPSSEDASSWRRRKMNPIDPAKLSTSFRRVCNRDFRGVQDKYHSPEQRRRNKGTDHYEFCVRANDTLDAIDEEQQLLSLHLPCCGIILEHFICSLSRILQWDSLLSDTIASNSMLADKRDGFVVLFTQHVLGALDFADAPLDQTLLQVPLMEACTSFMTEFFSRLSPEKVLWFQPVQATTSS